MRGSSEVALQLGFRGAGGYKGTAAGLLASMLMGEWMELSKMAGVEHFVDETSSSCEWE